MKAYVDRSSLFHFLALASLAQVRGPAVSRIAAGAGLWGKLRRWEACGARLALRLCNGPEFKPGEVEKEKARIVAGVLGVLGRSRLPRRARLFVKGDPRGYSLQLDFGMGHPMRGARPGLHRDWGGYWILAPEFGGRS